ncbi:MAG: hypothetical protein GC206_00150 [Alphaproteobacteria bacterium]|nr:hypothetical protein [Alphaproteobacteria bacterium]
MGRAILKAMARRAAARQRLRARRGGRHGASIPELDAAILACARQSQMKVRWLILEAQEHLVGRGKFVGDAALGERVRALVSSGDLEGFGDLDLWGRSEVRLRNRPTKTE